LGCFSITDKVVATVCNPVVVGIGSASSNMGAKFERELQYRCSVDSGKVSDITNAVLTVARLATLQM